MAITSLSFIYFVFGALIVYHLLPRRSQNYWLLLVSYGFCISWAWQFALTLMLLTGTNFCLAHRLHKGNSYRSVWLRLGIGLNVVALLGFRLGDFFVPAMLEMLARYGWSTQAGGLHILLPLGLSYYVLENISYLIDVYRGQTRASQDIVDYALYLAYFPKLVAGPIERARFFLPKLASPRIVASDLLARSFTLIVVGVGRKFVIADTLAAAIPSRVFESPGVYIPPELLGWLVIYAFSLYNDFAGYTNMVRGVSGLFGIELSANFQQPYLARNFTEFWNRWHISLSHWLRDYIYFPVSRALLRRNPSRRNLANLIVPPMVTMLVSGLWHGLHWHMVVWGGMHGLYQVIERLPSLWRPIIPPSQWPRWRQNVSRLVIFLLVTLAWVPFTMELPVALGYWQGLLDWPDAGIHRWRLLMVIPFVLAAIGVDWVQQKQQDECAFLRWPRLQQAGILAAVALFVFIVSHGDSGPPFVYQGF